MLAAARNKLTNKPISLNHLIGAIFRIRGAQIRLRHKTSFQVLELALPISPHNNNNSNNNSHSNSYSNRFNNSHSSRSRLRYQRRRIKLRIQLIFLSFQDLILSSPLINHSSLNKNSNSNKLKPYNSHNSSSSFNNSRRYQSHKILIYWGFMSKR